MGRGQLRYWSLCGNEAFSQRVYACITDEQVKTYDAQGDVTVAVSQSKTVPPMRRCRATSTGCPQDLRRTPPSCCGTCCRLSRSQRHCTMLGLATSNGTWARTIRQPVVSISGAVRRSPRLPAVSLSSSFGAPGEVFGEVERG